MDEQEVLNQIRELQKQRTSLKEQDTHLVVQIGELRDKLWLYNIKRDTILIIIVYSVKSMILKITVCSYMN